MRRGILSRKPETAGQIAWDWSVAYGAAGLVVLVLIVPAARLPVVGPLIPLDRVNGGPALAARVEPVRALARARFGEEPALIADRYGRAAWLAFYLEGRPSVASADSARGGRESSYDYFEDTRLGSPALVGRPAVLIGGRAAVWELAGLDLEGLETVSEGEVPIHVVRRYGGRRSLGERASGGTEAER